MSCQHCMYRYKLLVGLESILALNGINYWVISWLFVECLRVVAMESNLVQIEPKSRRCAKRIFDIFKSLSLTYQGVKYYLIASILNVRYDTAIRRNCSIATPDCTIGSPSFNANFGIISVSEAFSVLDYSRDVTLRQHIRDRRFWANVGELSTYAEIFLPETLQQAQIGLFLYYLHSQLSPKRWVFLK